MPGPVMPKTIKCKFCKADVRYDKCGGRVWEMDRDEYHSPHCPRRQAHFKQEAAERVQAKRNPCPPSPRPTGRSGDSTHEGAIAMEQRIGTCGNCGGDVMGYAGPWMGVLPPPPPKCNKCGATPRGYDDVLQMNPPVPGRPATREWTTTAASPVRFDREECTPPHGGKEK